jgi:hypothetical protein
VQPVQLSLIPDQAPAPPPAPAGQLPAPAVGAAIVLLADLIAKAARPRAGRPRAAGGDGEEAGDE